MAESIGRYEIVGELGRGAMGIVYKALDPTIGRTVALKTLRLDTQGVAVADMMKRFKHEARLAGAMNHPNIVTIYDAGDHGDVFYIAMEFIEGVTLQSILHEQGRSPIPKMVEMSRHICGALDYAHQRGVIHRDIKPANIMTTPLGSVKIMDFGIAKSEAGITSAGQVLGTPAYMSPEQVQGKDLDGRSDLFSFGVMLYEMVTGEMPFSGKNVTTIIYKIVHEAPIPPRQLDPSIHPALSNIITKALAKSPEQRYQTGADLVRDLENYKSVTVDPNATRIIGGSMPTRVVQPTSPDSPTIGMTAHMQSQAAPGATVEMKASGPVRAAAAAMPAKVKLASIANKKPAPPPKKSRNAVVAVSIVLVVMLLAARVIRSKQLAIHPVTQSANVAPMAAPTQATWIQPAVKPAPVDSTVPPVVDKPKPVIPAAPHFGELQITSTPPGASVTIAGETHDGWTTPFRAKKLLPGNYEVAFSLPNYETESMKVKVVAGQTLSIGADLTPYGGTLSINTDPPGANIFVDGQPTGKRTPDQISVNAGPHKILVQKAGYFPENTAVSLQNGQTYAFEPTLQPQKANPAGNAGQRGGFNQGPGAGFGGGTAQGGGPFAGFGMVIIRTNPPGATVQVNGRTLPKSTPTRSPVPAGKYRMTISLDGYKTVQRDFAVEAGKPTQMQVDLSPR